MITGKKLVERLREIKDQVGSDPEIAHSQADNLLVAFAAGRCPREALEIDEAWNDIEKWYA